MLCSWCDLQDGPQTVVLKADCRGEYNDAPQGGSRLSFADGHASQQAVSIVPDADATAHDEYRMTATCL